MGRDVRPPPLRLLAGRLDLVGAILHAFQWIGLRGHAAGDHDLDEVRPLTQFLPRGMYHFGHPIGHPPAEGRAGSMGTFKPLLRLAPEIRVAPRLSDGHPGDKESRRIHDAGLYRRLDAVVGPAQVPQCGEAAHEHAAHGRDRPCGEQGHRHIFEVMDVHLADECVDMRVDQSRYECPVADVDTDSLGGLDRPIRHLLDPIAFN